MDRRFVCVWHELKERAAQERFDKAIAKTSPERLVKALAAAGTEDPLAANAIATELLNRLNRARFLGGFAALAASAILVAEMTMGGLGVLQRNAAALDIPVASALVALLALAALALVVQAWKRLHHRGSP